MTKATQSIGRAGRPRMFEDDGAFTATARALGRVGYRQLTLAVVAEEIGCTPQALYKRFESKRRLLLQFAEWSTLQGEQRYREARENHDSPLEALRARVMMPAETRPDELHDPATMARTLSFRLETIDDPEFRELWERRDRMLETELVRTLQEAQSAGELVPNCDPVKLGRTLHAALAGATIIAAWRSEEPLQERFQMILEAILAPNCSEKRKGSSK